MLENIYLDNCKCVVLNGGLTYKISDKEKTTGKKITKIIFNQIPSPHVYIELDGKDHMAHFSHDIALYF